MFVAVVAKGRFDLVVLLPFCPTSSEGSSTTISPAPSASTSTIQWSNRLDPMLPVSAPTLNHVRLSGLYSLASLLPSDIAASVPSLAHSLSVLSRLSRLALDLQAEQPIDDDDDDDDGQLTTDILRRTIPGIIEQYNFP